MIVLESGGELLSGAELLVEVVSSDAGEVAVAGTGS